MTLDATLAHRRTGAGPLRVLLLHGFSDSAACWDPFINRHRDLGGILAVDAGGHGRSPLPAGRVGPRQQATDHAATLLDMEINRPLIVIGHSMGALTALALAADHPEFVSALILEDPPLDAGNAQIRGVPAWLTELRSLDSARRIARGRSENPAWSHDELLPWAQSKAELDLDFCRRAGDTLDPVTELLPLVTCPLLLVGGSPENGAMLSTHAIDRAGSLATADVSSAIIRTAGHNVRRDNPHAFDAAVRQFLATYGEIAR
jgi:pimeloyl-ACP methyl ester carboxylesterase